MKFVEPIKNIQKEKEHLRRLKKMRSAIFTKVAPLQVEFHPSAEPIAAGRQFQLDYRPIHKNGIWGGIFSCAWFRVRGVVPPTAAGKHVVVHINVGGEGVVYDGVEPISSITLVSSYIDRLQASVSKSIIEVAPHAQTGEAVEFYIDAGYNGYFNYPYGWGIFHYADLCVVDDALLDYYYDYLCLSSLLSVTSVPVKRARLNQLLNSSYDQLSISAAEARKILQPLFAAEVDKSIAFTAVGHSHLDLAWLWPLRETKRKAQRTFANQLNNAARYPDYIYGASQPWMFEYVKENYPQQYSALQQMALRGQLELQGGMWVEADTNLASGEALIRQIHYGTDFFRREFGQEMKICWLPDVFGYNGNLPQILKKSGLPFFMTTKLSWNEHNRFPYRSFVWHGIDNSEVLVHMPPDDTYNSAGSPACTLHAAENYSECNQAPVGLMVYGIGDGGGGPGEAHIELIKRQKSLAGVPAVQPGKAIDFFTKLEQYKGNLPAYNGELYLEKHQGTYTTQGANKKYNRQCEYALQDLEALCTLAAEKGFDYPQEKLDRWWKEVLLYQFHDIIPGSSITRVYVESRARYAHILEEIHAERDQVLDYLANGEGKCAFNPTSFSREEFIKLEGQWYSLKAEPYGFATLQELQPINDLHFTENTIENNRVCLRFSPHGDILSAVDKESGFDYAESRLNTLRLYRDKWLFFNAWDIDWKYYEKPSLELKAHRHETFIDGAKVVRRNHYRHGRTVLIQEVTLFSDRPVVYFKTQCDYHETFKMLRADFDAAVHSPFVTCDIQLGSLQRSTGDTTPIEKAQFEICAHKYVDLSDGMHGISLMNNCKYGHRVKGNRMSLNLLRSPISPDSKADRHEHQFTYALYFHSGDCNQQTLSLSYALNKPLIPLNGTVNIPSIASTDNPAVVIETIKEAYAKDGIILRLYESQGKPTACRLQTVFAFGSAVETDLMENVTGSLDLNQLEFNAFEIKTIKLQRESSGEQ